ncbi:MAG: 5-bromo-4-chloroindolyl phosphate hydrolysis family protein [Bacilli bacterium]|nr:5-bromo-4-chloroindolyl phosphate hydrolysis family protein [Bacilli bacterium]
MKNKEVLSGILGGTFFAATYLAVGIPIIPALAVGAAAFVGSELLMSKTNIFVFDKVDEKNVEQVLNDARMKNKFILDMVLKVDDEEVQEYLRGINTTTGKIISTVQKNRKKIKQSEKFFTYYLPITVGIVEKYDDIENQRLSSKDAKKYFESSKETLREINSSFKKILNNMYESDIENATADMKVLNNILKSDGYSDIKINKEENDE